VTATTDSLRGRSEALRRFVAEAPLERETIAGFLTAAAAELPSGARVADIGAGEAPYRELFAHTDYVTVDWAQTIHEGPRAGVDIVASADAIPVDDASFDAVLLTQVLEHVPEPARVLAELRRVLRPGGRLYLTAPLVWELHELPHDYYRYTEPGLRHLLDGAGYVDVRVEPRNDCFTTLAQLMHNVGWIMGDPDDELKERRAAAREVLAELAEAVAALAPLDHERRLPLGYSARATRPG
jgi:SAM-dependent methyltransferase